MATDEEIIKDAMAKKNNCNNKRPCNHCDDLRMMVIDNPDEAFNIMQLARADERKARDAELLDFLKISRDNNPYPVDIFISVEGKAARNAYTVAIEDIEKFIAESSPQKPEEKKEVK